MILDSLTGWVFLRFDGRISREVYWLGLMFLWSVFGMFLSMFQNVPDMRVIAAFGLFLHVLFMIWATVALVVKRAHDKGLPGVVAFLLVVPFLGEMTVIYLGVVAGDPGPNPFGRAANVLPNPGAPPGG